MKNILLIIALILIPVEVFCQPVIKFENEKYNFGKVTSAENLECVFEFTNAGMEDLIIDSLIPS
jgi:hypothetical protein